MSENETIFTPKVDLRDSEVQQAGWVEDSSVAVRPSALRASNTTKTLKPTEVVASIFEQEGVDTCVRELPTPSIPQEVWDVLKKSESAMNLATGVQESGLFTGNEQPEKLNNTETVYGSPEENLKKLMSGDFSGLPDSGAFAYTPDEPKVKDDPIWVISAILDRLETLEDKFQELSARIERHNQRAQHRI